MNPSLFHTQRGVALVVSMVMLVAITLIGVFVMSGSHLEWLMSNNSRFQADAGVHAESALFDGENNIVSTPPASITWDSTPGFYNTATLVNKKDPRKVSNWSNLTTINASPAQYIVEYLGQSCLVNTPPYTTTISCFTNPGMIYLKMSTYRVWALAADSKGAVRIAQSTYRKIDNPHADLTIGSNIIPANNPSTQPSYQRIDYAVINND